MLKSSARQGLKKAILFLVFLGPLAVVLDSCLGARCKCGNVDAWYKIEKVELNIRSHIPGSSEYTYVGDSGKVDQNKLVVFLHFQYSFYTQWQAPSFKFQLVNSAMACDCVQPGYLGSKEKIKNITFTTANTYNSNYKAGDTINPIILIDNKSIPDYIADWNQAKGGISNRMEEIFLSQAPDIEQWHKLKITVEYGSNTISTASVVFRIQP